MAICPHSASFAFVSFKECTQARAHAPTHLPKEGRACRRCARHHASTGRPPHQRRHRLSQLLLLLMVLVVLGCGRPTFLPRQRRAGEADPPCVQHSLRIVRYWLSHAP